MKKLLVLFIVIMLVLPGCSLISEINDSINDSMDQEIEDWNNDELEKALSELDAQEIDDWLNNGLEDILAEIDDAEIDKWNNEELEKALEEFEDDDEIIIDQDDTSDNDSGELVDEASDDSSPGNNSGGNISEGATDEATTDETGRIKFSEVHDLSASYEGQSVDSDTGTNVIGYDLTIDNGDVEWKTYFDGVHVYTSDEGVPLLNAELFYMIPGEYVTYNNEEVYYIDFSDDELIMEIWYSIEYLIPLKFHSEMVDSESTTVVDYELTELSVKE